MRHGKDDRTLDIFEVPQPVLATPGCGNYAVQVSELVGEILKGSELDRYEIAAQMSRLSGDDVSKHMLTLIEKLKSPDDGADRSRKAA